MTLSLDQVVAGDCLDVMTSWPRGCIDLIYLDPPFNTGKTHRASNGAYCDCWDDMNSYLHFMRPRMELTRDLLKPSGSVLLHCDWRTCHHFRLMLDDLFGPDHFINQLIWSYGLGGSSPRRFARKHDDILFYARGPGYYFAPPRVPATSQRMRGMTKKATDVIEIPSINNMALERVGYPTQKPLALLNLLIGACCPPGGIVLDPFCGSGTAMVAAQQSGRRFLGIDINSQAVAIARTRCKAVTLTAAPRSRRSRTPAPARTPAAAISR